jgi:6-phosphogluconolactonase
VHVYFGTYTRYGTSEGIYVYNLDAEAGGLTRLQVVAGPHDPTYLALDPTEQYLYALDGTPDAGAVSAFRRDRHTGQLSYLNTAPSGGKHAAHVSVDPTGRCVLVADYQGSTVSAHPRSSDGRVAPATEVIHHTGHSAHPERQAAPHPHMIQCAPGGDVALVPDLGLDEVLAYRVDAAAARLGRVEGGGTRLPPGAGPRHLAFHPNGRFVYLVTELTSTLVVCTYEADGAQLRIIQTQSLLPAGWSGESAAAAVVVHPNGAFVYASNRGHDSVASFRIDQASGMAELLSHTSTQGKVPRDINLDPSGRFLLAANQDSDSAVVFSVDQTSGGLRAVAEPTAVPKPVRVLFASQPAD